MERGREGEGGRARASERGWEGLTEGRKDGGREGGREGGRIQIHRKR